MSSICWAGSQDRRVARESVRGTMAPRLILSGLWVLNLTILTFALPLLLFANLNKTGRRPDAEHAPNLSKTAHP